MAAASVPQRDSRAGRPLVIGLTGPIASGKSMVAAHLRRHGAEILDADQIYRSLIGPRSDLSVQIASQFGSEVLAPDGGVDRAALGEHVFGNPVALADLERITHPSVVAAIRTLVDRSQAPVVVIEAVKLVQSGLATEVDSLWHITANEDTRLKRLMARSGLDEVRARARIAAAPSVVPEGFPVDFSLDNSGDWVVTVRAIDDMWEALTDGKGKSNQ